MDQHATVAAVKGDAAVVVDREHANEGGDTRRSWGGIAWMSLCSSGSTRVAEQWRRRRTMEHAVAAQEAAGRRGRAAKPCRPGCVD